MLFVHPVTEVFKAVADDEIIHFQQKIVGRNLVERLLLNWYSRGLVFDNHHGFRHLII